MWDDEGPRYVSDNQMVLSKGGVKGHVVCDVHFNNS